MRQPVQLEAVAVGVFTEYCEAAMRSVCVERRDDGLWYAFIPPCEGVWAAELTREQALHLLREVLEEWVGLGWWSHTPLPPINRATLAPG
ncbi:MAG: type II toxin-antitoxin system HicB family antitoxin [Firmicutes bacterium]|nr:type II toxin-antitoxin system HicB family antitoxin [Alicyclobacillaceae bacterium]MCL6497393.1 type II toxin-antitoxin system HicB family antitoxin [Bacillota bacterium]